MAAKNIDPRTLARAFATFLAEEGIDLEKSLNAGLCAMIDFYSTVRADGCDLDADQDMGNRWCPSPGEAPNSRALF